MDMNSEEKDLLATNTSLKEEVLKLKNQIDRLEKECDDFAVENSYLRNQLELYQKGNHGKDQHNEGEDLEGSGKYINDTSLWQMPTVFEENISQSSLSSFPRHFKSTLKGAHENKNIICCCFVNVNGIPILVTGGVDMNVLAFNVAVPSNPEIFRCTLRSPSVSICSLPDNNLRGGFIACGLMDGSWMDHIYVYTSG